jgi:hypothetical protein
MAAICYGWTFGEIGSLCLLAEASSITVIM